MNELNFSDFLTFEFPLNFRELNLKVSEFKNYFDTYDFSFVTGVNHPKIITNLHETDTAIILSILNVSLLNQNYELSSLILTLKIQFPGKNTSILITEENAPNFKLFIHKYTKTN